eukprot:3887992-Rhodomonas_salina.1
MKGTARCTTTAQCNRRAISLEGRGRHPSVRVILAEIGGLMDRFLIIGLLLCLGNVLPEPPTADRLWTSRSIHPRSVRFDSRQSLLPVVALRGGRNTEREGKPDIFQRYGIVSDASEEDTGEEGEGQNDELGDGVQTELGEEDKVRMREEWEAFQHMTMAGGDEPKSPKEL